MSDTQHTRAEPRPWYCRDEVVDEYRQTLRGGEELTMIRTLKIARSIIVNVGIIAIGLYAISQGGDATLVGGVALAVLGGYNGLELSDYAALLQAYKEVQNDE